MTDLKSTALYQWWLRRWREVTVRPFVGSIDFGDLRTLAPLSREFGYERGLPIDRYYIEQFLAAHADAIRGLVLEIGDDAYTRRFGAERVSHSDVLHLTEGNRKATLVGDLTSADHIPENSFDCVIFTQTLQFIYDHRAALATLHRILKPEGVVLATVPGITKIPQDQWGELCAWSYTGYSAKSLFSETFAQASVHVQTKGNVLAACAFLHGIATEELTTEELEHDDPLYPVVISIHACKAG